MRVLLAALALVLGAMVAQVPAVQAQEASTAEQAEQRMTLEMGRDLIRYGQASEDPLALVTGAKLMAGVPGGAAAAEETGFELNEVLAAATTLADGNEAIATLAAEVQAMVDESERGVCYWQYYCYWNGYCEYWWVCF